MDKYDITQSIGIMGLYLFFAGGLGCLDWTISHDVKFGVIMFSILGMVLMLIAASIENYWERKCKK